MDFKNKNVLVLGLARSGISAALLLKEKGALVTIQDLKTEENLDKKNLSVLRENGIRLYLGKNPDEIIKDFDLLVISPGIPTDLPFLEKAREMKIPIIGEIELGYSVCKSPLIAITGTNGKTTTTALAGALMKKSKPSVKILGNIGLAFTEEALNTSEEGIVVLEASSFQLETIKSFRPKISCVLNISPDHLDRHKTMENYISAKERIFENQQSEDFIVLNYDDEKTREMAQKTKARVLFFSSSQKISDGIYLKDNNIFYMDKPLINVSELKILGLHNYENAMAAAAIAICAKVPIEKIIEGLKEFAGVAHRIEYIATKNDVEFFNDSKGTNPDSAIKAILAMKRPIVLIAGGYEKNSDFDEWIKYFNGRVKFAAVIGAVKDRLAESLLKNNFTSFEKADTFEEAFSLALKNAEGGDCVLLSPACASWGMFENFEKRGDLFRSLVNEIS